MTLIDEDILNELLKRNKNEGGGARNSVALFGAILWGLTASELTLLRVRDVLNQDGSLKFDWQLPEHIAYNGYARPLSTCHPKHIAALQEYIEDRKNKKIGVSNLGAFDRLDPDSSLVLTDKGAQYGMSPRKGKEGTKTNYQPTGMTNLFKRMVRRTRYAGDIKYSDFRNSFIIHMYRAMAGCPSMRELIEVSGIRDYESLKKIVIMDKEEIKKPIKNLFIRL